MNRVRRLISAWVMTLVGSLLLPLANAAAVSGTTYDTAGTTTTTAATIAQHATAVEAVSRGETSLRSMASDQLRFRLGSIRNLDAPKSADPWLSRQGVRPAPGTRVRPQGVPENWRIRGTDTPGGVRYYDPQNPGHSVRVMQGSPGSPYPNSQAPYVRWQYHGQPLDVNGNVLPTARTTDAHIPLQDFKFNPKVYSR
jgi:hypothetical protein